MILTEQCLIVVASELFLCCQLGYLCSCFPGEETWGDSLDCCRSSYQHGRILSPDISQSYWAIHPEMLYLPRVWWRIKYVAGCQFCSLIPDVFFSLEEAPCIIMSLLALIRMPGFVSWGVWSRKVVVKFYSALGTDLVWCQDNRFFWSQSSVLWECWVRTVRWGELREEQGSLFLIMKILAVIAYKTSRLKCSCSSLVTEDQRESLPVECLTGHYTILPFRDQGITSLPAGWASRSLATSLAVLLLRENERIVFHSSDRFNFCNVGTMKWMQTCLIYILCGAIESSQTWESNPQSCWISSVRSSSPKTQENVCLFLFHFLCRFHVGNPCPSLVAGLPGAACSTFVSQGCLPI